MGWCGSRVGVIHHDSRLREYPRIELTRLVTCVEDNIVEEDGVEDIDWHGVIGDYLEWSAAPKGGE